MMALARASAARPAVWHLSAGRPPKAEAIVSCVMSEASSRCLPLANSVAIASRVAGAELHVYEGGHAFFVQDRAALPDIISFLTAEGP